jgi:hypothetical protein
MTTDKLSIEFLNPGDCVFSFNNNGFLIFTLEGNAVGRVKLIRTYPYTLTDEYICVHDLEDKEIGIIRDLNELDADSCENAKKELEGRYYCPTVTAIKSVKERMGHFYFQTVVDGKEKSFTVRDITRNMRFANGDTLLIFDMDGNRYVIPNFEKTEPKSKRLLEPYLY